MTKRSSSRGRPTVESRVEALDLASVKKAKLIYSQFGIAGLLVALCVLLWWNWDAVKSKPGIQNLIERIAAQALPSCGDSSFCVAVMHLENDDHRNYEDLLVAGLAAAEGITVLRFDRTISLQGPRPQEMIAAGHLKARQYLGSAAGHVVLWGHVQHRDGKGVPLLYWTTNENTGLPRAYGYYDPSGVELPAIFWTDFSEVLQLLVMHDYAQYKEQRGQYLGQRLVPFIDRVRSLLTNSTQVKNFDPKAKFQTRMILASTLETFGEQTGQNQPLEEAIAQYRQAAEERSRMVAPLDWAAAQNGLSSALRELGERETGTARLKEAVSAAQLALSQRTRERFPMDWAASQVNLGHALRSLGERQADTESFRQAIAAFRAALEEETRERAPVDWAGTQHELGNALRALGQREDGTSSYMLAVTAYREALKERTRDRFPLSWAVTQDYLGTALRLLGERQDNVEYLQLAIAAHRDALKERTRDRVPLSWAVSQHNLGEALRALGQREPGNEHLQEAVAAYREALEERKRELVPLHWASTQDSLGTALRLLGERTDSSESLEAAVEAYRAALLELGPDRSPLSWAFTEDNFGVALTALAERKHDKAHMEEAVRAFDLALTVRKRTNFPSQWSSTRTHRERALKDLNDLSNVVPRQRSARMLTHLLDYSQTTGKL